MQHSYLSCRNKASYYNVSKVPLLLERLQLPEHCESEIVGRTSRTGCQLDGVVVVWDLDAEATILGHVVLPHLRCDADKHCLAQFPVIYRGVPSSRA